MSVGFGHAPKKSSHHLVWETAQAEIPGVYLHIKRQRNSGQDLLNKAH